MNSRQEDRFTMMYATRSVLNDHAAQVASVPALAAMKTELDVNITTIEQLLAVQVKDLRGHTKAKAEARTLMEEKTIEVSGRVMAYAVTVEDEGLAEEMNLSASELENYRDSVVAQRCQGVATAAADHAAGVAPFGVAVADTVELQARIDAYVALVQLPRNLTVTRKQATTQIGMLVRDTMKLLQLRMDMVVRGFLYSDEAFYTKYTAARIVVDTGGSEKVEEVAA